MIYKKSINSHYNALYKSIAIIMPYIESINRNYNYQDSSVDSTVMDGHRQGKKA